jgi:imidazolonepropionase
LVDSHTHPVWSGDRCFEFALKLQGASYMDIHEKGGGIGYTVSQVHNTDEATLVKLMKERIDRMVTFGTTTVEAKSGNNFEFFSSLNICFR